MSLSSSFVNELRLLGFLIGPLVKRSPLFNTPYRGGVVIRQSYEKSKMLRGGGIFLSWRVNF